jgi:hypothetical protein
MKMAGQAYDCAAPDDAVGSFQDPHRAKNKYSVEKDLADAPSGAAASCHEPMNSRGKDRAGNGSPENTNNMEWRRSGRVDL